MEGARQQVVDSELPRVTARANKDDACFRRREFGNLLAAASAGSAVLDIIAAANDDDDANFLTTGRNHCADRIGFGATAFRVGCIFDIAANMHAALFIEQSRAHEII